MPRVVRNFWIELVVDGKKTVVETGPKSSHGGADITIQVRENGTICPHKLRVTCRNDRNDDNVIFLEVCGGGQSIIPVIGVDGAVMRKKR